MPEKHQTRSQHDAFAGTQDASFWRMGGFLAPQVQFVLPHFYVAWYAR